MNNLPARLTSTALRAAVKAGPLTTNEDQMPDTGQINDTRWKKLPEPLASTTLARFDQDKCTANHGISKRAMCFGLSLSWNSMIHGGQEHPTPYASAERMRFLGAFEGVVHARTLKNFYRSEHKFQLNFARENPGVTSAAMAGTRSLLQAAELKGLSLKPVLEDKTLSDLPFLIACEQQGRYRSVDDKALKQVSDAMISSGKGVLAIYSDNQAHALGFSIVKDGKNTLLFDPNLGEFQVESTTLPYVIESLSDTNRLPLIGVQVFASHLR
uniref:Probable cysteine protease avirulence protein avrPpiC2 n=1 Tax=Erwinia amylovora ATCC BAA-2158 TaxID=889211 RepID=E5B288_ERWAM|nr:probable cysteine protease avirulence protein avrPpiC2 [Erwinia amylovora ATCC BAA-2158]